ncbi:MAG: glycosyltransferase family 2 protein [Gammaproteobacteria bacterium]|nr:MAG: glycosyltransferase family 2 protein [Gammaproteobacteria bacterium]
MSAPITLFTYSRLAHTRQTVEALKANAIASESDLIVFCDAAKSKKDELQVDCVRAYIRALDGFRSVKIHEREENYGLAKSIIDGVTQVCKEYGRAIVLEDDMVTSPHFLTYMNEALDRFCMDERVVSIHGYSYPVVEKLPEAFFLRGADCWGWGTWRRGWDIFNPDGRFLLSELKRRDLLSAFDLNGAFKYSEMLAEQINGRNDSWAVRWHASCFLADKLTLYPGTSLVHNIGNDGSGVHSGSTGKFDALLSEMPIDLSGIEVGPSSTGKLAFERFLRGIKSNVFTQLFHRMRGL